MFPGIPAFAQPTFDPADAVRLTHAERYATLVSLRATTAAAWDRLWKHAVKTTRRAGRPVSMVAAGLVTPRRKWFHLERR